MYSHSFMGWGVGISQLLDKLDLRYFNGSLYTHSAACTTYTTHPSSAQMMMGWGVVWREASHQTAYTTHPSSAHSSDDDGVGGGLV